MTKLLVVGQLFGNSGYANHTKYLVNALYNEGVDIALECQLVPGWERLVNDNELKMIKNPRANYDAILLITLPTVAPLYWNTDKPVLQYAVWEGTHIPYHWIHILNDDKITKIITPSQHTRDAILEIFHDNLADKEDDGAIAYIDEKIEVIPHGVDNNIFKPLSIEKNKEFTFLCNKGWPSGTLDRGGLSFLIKAFMEEFNSTENVKLSVKLNLAYGMNDQIMNRNFTELDIQNKSPGRIEIIAQDLTNQQLCEWYNKGHVYCIPSLAEAFCIPGIEAMACGLPVIYNDFGGQMEYCNIYNGWPLINGKMIEVDWDLQYEGCSWKIPNILEIRNALRHIYENQQEVKDKCIKSLETSNQFTWSQAAQKVIDLIL